MWVLINTILTYEMKIIKIIEKKKKIIGGKKNCVMKMFVFILLKYENS